MTIAAEALFARATHDHKKRWREKVATAVEGFKLGEVHDGSWFRVLLERHARKHNATHPLAHWDALYPGMEMEQRADLHVGRVAKKAAAAGAAASVGASAGELLSLLTEGLAAPVGVPAAVFSIVAEGAYTTLIQLDLASDIASMYGVAFGDDVEEMSTLFALALGVELPKKKAPAEPDSEPKLQRGLLARLMELEDGEIATHLGKKLLEEAVLRNIVPVVGVAISARWNYVATIKFADGARKYARFRRALTTACTSLHLFGVSNPEVFVRGAWLLASCDGEPTHDEMMAVARVLDQFPDSEKELPTFDIDDEEAWFQRLARLPSDVGERLIDMLSLVAATDKHLGVSERRFLGRVGKTLGHPIDFDRIEKLCAHLQEGHELPPHFFAGTEPSPQS